MQNNSPKADTDLLKQMAAGGPLQAVFILGDAPLKPSATRRHVTDLVKRAEKRSGVKHTLLTVFENLGSFLIGGDQALIRALLDDPAIDSAMANQQSRSFHIKPVS